MCVFQIQTGVRGLLHISNNRRLCYLNAPSQCSCYYTPLITGCPIPAQGPWAWCWGCYGDGRDSPLLCPHHDTFPHSWTSAEGVVTRAGQLHCHSNHGPTSLSYHNQCCPEPPEGRPRTVLLHLKRDIPGCQALTSQEECPRDSPPRYLEGCHSSRGTGKSQDSRTISQEGRPRTVLEYV